MSGHPQQGHYDDGYGQQPRAGDAYYDDHNQGYYDHNDGYQDYGHQNGQQHPQQHGGEGYYDEGLATCNA
jgi:1,3-beta-glucan synthase